MGVLICRFELQPPKNKGGCNQVHRLQPQPPLRNLPVATPGCNNLQPNTTQVATNSYNHLALKKCAMYIFLCEHAIFEIGVSKPQDGRGILNANLPWWSNCSSVLTVAVFSLIDYAVLVFCIDTRLIRQWQSICPHHHIHFAVAKLDQQ